MSSEIIDISLVQDTLEVSARQVAIPYPLARIIETQFGMIPRVQLSPSQREALANRHDENQLPPKPQE